jgi:hypothetical protein
MSNASLDISSKVDRSEITIGDHIRYEITVAYPKDGHVELPSVLGNLGSFEVKDFQVTDPKDQGGLTVQTWRFDISTYTVGKYTLPPQIINFRQGTDTTAAAFYTQPIEINVIRTSPETVKDIADIAALAEVKQGTPWIIYGLGAIAILTLIIGFWRRLRTKRVFVARKPVLPPFDEAMAKLAGVKDLSLIRQNRAREFCFVLSEALRRYLDRRYGISSLESTTSEFLGQSRTLPVTSAQKQWLAEFCDKTDLVKFANAALLESDASALIAKVEEFLKQTKPTEMEQAQGKGGTQSAGAGKKAPAKPSTAKPPSTKSAQASKNGAAAPGSKDQGKAAPGPGFIQGGHGHDDDRPAGPSREWKA